MTAKMKEKRHQKRHGVSARSVNEKACGKRRSISKEKAKHGGHGIMKQATIDT